MDYKQKLIERYLYIYKNQNTFLDLINRNVDIYQALENILLSEKHLTENEYYYYLEHFKKIKKELSHENVNIILNYIYNYIKGQKKDKENANIKLQVINEYLSICAKGEKVNKEFKRNKEDIGVSNNEFINTFSYGPPYFYSTALHLTKEDKEKILKKKE